MPVLEALPPACTPASTPASRQQITADQSPTVMPVETTEAPLHFDAASAVVLGSARSSAPKRQPKIPTSDIRVKNTHRLIASKYSGSGTVLSRLSSNPDTLGKLLELDDATNDRFLGEEGLLPGIGIHELVYGIRYAHIVNAAYTHASPTGGRFNSATRGAWYASLDRATSVAEVAFHKLRHLEEIDWPHVEISTCDDYLADIISSFHDLRELRAALGPDGQNGLGTVPPPLQIEPDSHVLPIRNETFGVAAGRNSFARYLRPDPIPACYARPQRLAERLLSRRSNGIVYPSVRQPGGTCLAIFRPALVYNVRRGARLEMRLQSHQPFHASQVSEVAVPKP